MLETKLSLKVQLYSMSDISHLALIQLIEFSVNCLALYGRLLACREDAIIFREETMKGQS